ncbi:3' terminal RNA ribose 2'-O-methyltransferase Hen1 [Nocardia carnea]|uniref:3' terminal RNA ribose 2'-O-methyltransferase Hen1 n=1 Tax=Nocardia carnea TaxID=37328 RepID=UPI0024541028|nr:3' terminal RNA ribose 2'-O-methyltransferase Hen1 [Nocardia carnea]
MLLTITCTPEPGSTTPATDLGFLLHKNPDRVQEFGLSYGTAHVFYPHASAERCTAALLLEVDPVRLVRGRARDLQAFSLGQYVNDRPYAASSLLSVAIGSVFRSALRGECAQRPGLADTPLPLRLELPALGCRGGAGLVERIFAPLGWTVDATPLPLDPAFPEWGDSAHLRLVLTGTVRVADALNHLYVLLPVLDGAKHYWLDAGEVDKLLRAGGTWLAAHPERGWITRRYLARRQSLIRTALARLAELDHSDPEELDAIDEAPTEDEPNEPPREARATSEPLSRTGDLDARTPRHPSPARATATSIRGSTGQPATAPSGTRSHGATVPGGANSAGAAASAAAAAGGNQARSPEEPRSRRADTEVRDTAIGVRAAMDGATPAGASGDPGSVAPSSVAGSGSASSNGDGSAPPLAVQRRAAVVAALRETGATRVLDLGCGEGALLRELLGDRSFQEIVGVDVSTRALSIARRRLRLDRLPAAVTHRLTLRQGSLTYTDNALRGFDAAVLMEVIEHIDPPRLPAVEYVVFGAAAPRSVLVTTPNAEYNVRYDGLPAGKFRHGDHRFEWSRAEFGAWARRIAGHYGYRVQFAPIGGADPEVGPPTQLAVFTRTGTEGVPQ